MFAECIDMSRLFDFSLYRRTEELLRTAEKELSGRFHSTENVQIMVYKRAFCRKWTPQRCLRRRV